MSAKWSRVLDGDVEVARFTGSGDAWHYAHEIAARPYTGLVTIRRGTKLEWRDPTPRVKRS